MDWCLSALSWNETFSNVIFVDESCVEMSSSGRIIFHQKSMRLECPTLKVAKRNHPYKVRLIQYFLLCSVSESITLGSEGPVQDPKSRLLGMARGPVVCTTITV